MKKRSAKDEEARMRNRKSAETGHKDALGNPEQEARRGLRLLTQTSEYEVIRDEDEEEPYRPAEKPSPQRQRPHPQAEIVYEEEEGKPRQRGSVPKAFYIFGLLLTVAVVLVMIWMNRSSLTVENIKTWMKTQTVGTGVGDGFPVTLPGNSVRPGNFLELDGKLVLLSDTALTVLSDTGKELAYERHSFEAPYIKSENGYLAACNLGGKGFFLHDGSERIHTGTAEGEIFAIAVGGDGSFAIGRRGGTFASEIDVYTAAGEKKYHYGFENDYVMALSMNGTGTKGIACVQGSQQGVAQSRVVILDFGQQSPVAEYVMSDVVVFDALWAKDGALYVVGDQKALVGSETDYHFTPYEFENRNLTAYSLEENQLTLSLSPHEYAGACKIVRLQGENTPTFIDTIQRVAALSVKGKTLAVLTGDTVTCYDSVTGEVVMDAGRDAIGVQGLSEGQVFVLGTTEIRKLLTAE